MSFTDIGVKSGKRSERLSLGDIQHRIPITPSPTLSHRNISREHHDLYPPMHNTIAVDKPHSPKEEEKKKLPLHIYIFSQLDIHGIGSLIKAERFFIRTIWVFILLLATGIMTFCLVQNVRDYIENPVLTTYDILSGEALEFPEVYICPTNFVNSTFVAENKVNLSWATYFSSAQNVNQNDSQGSMSFLNLKQSLWDRISIIPIGMPGNNMPPMPPFPAFPQGYVDENGTWVTYEVPTTTSTTTTTTTTGPPLTFQSLEQYFLAIGYEKEEFVKECSFQGQPLDCSSITTEHFDKDYGKCFLLKPNERQKKAGEGLSLVLDIHTKLYPTGDGLVNSPIFDGAYLMIRRHFHPAIFDKILVSPNEYTKIGLDARRIRRVSGNHGGRMKYCRSETESFHVLKLEEYSVDACHMDCTQHMVVETCGCVLAVDSAFLKPELIQRIRNNKSYSDLNEPIDGYCTASDMELCVKDVLNQNESEIQECMKECHPQCEEWTFVPTLSHLKFPAQMITYDMGTDLYEKVTQDTLILDISFLHLQLTDVIQSESMTAATFISNIGGQMGVWMGASILTLIQIILVAVSYIFPQKDT